MESALVSAVTLVQCPVCTLYLHRGMQLDVHLDTHPKDKVIQALCSLARPSPTSTPSSSLPSTPAPPVAVTSAPPLPAPPPPHPQHYLHHLQAVNFPSAAAPRTNNIIIASAAPPLANLSNLPAICDAAAASVTQQHRQQHHHHHHRLQPQQQHQRPPVYGKVGPGARGDKDGECEPGRGVGALPNLVMPVLNRYGGNAFSHRTVLANFDPRYAKRPGNAVTYQSNYADFINIGPVSIRESSATSLPSASVGKNSSDLDLPKYAPNEDCSDGVSRLRGLRILSDVKLEPPGQSNFNPETADFSKRSGLAEEESILPDLDGAVCDSYSRSRFSDGIYSTADSVVGSFRTDRAEDRTPTESPLSKSSFGSAAADNVFSVIKNIGNPGPVPDRSGKPSRTSKSETALSDLARKDSPYDDLVDDFSDRPYRRRTDFGEESAQTRPKPASSEAISETDKVYQKKPKKLLVKNLKSKINRLKRGGASSSNASVGSNYANEKSSDSVSFSYFPLKFEEKFFKEIVEDNPSEMKDAETKMSDINDDANEYPYRMPFDKEPEPPKIENSSESESVRPVNVIAFGSSNLTESNSERSYDMSDDSPLIENLPLKTSESVYAEGGSRSSNFIVERRSLNGSENNLIEDRVRKKETVEDAIEPERNEDGQYNWFPQKEEFTFTNFMQCSYNQGVYQKIDDGFDDKDFSGPVDKNYTELVCPQNDFEGGQKKFFIDTIKDRDISANESEALNIRTDERMPPRGELSEQESSGDMDAPWAGMYHDVGGSTSYDPIVRRGESWPSDGSDVDMPTSPVKHKFNENENEVEDVPIVVSVKPPDRNYKCATCGQGFNCPKERRVHRSKEHSASTLVTNTVERKFKRKQTLVKTNIKVKNEKVIKTECVVTKTQVNLLQMESETRLQIESKTLAETDTVYIKSDKIDLPELIEDKPNLELIKFEGKKKKTNYSCSTCGLVFTTELQFQEHTKIHPFECLTCGKLFSKRANLKLHIKRHLGIKNYRCDVCQKTFITKQKLSEHYNIHTGKSPIKCNLCNLTFRRHSNMTQHRNRHHFLIKRRLRDYVCICGEVFHSKKKLAWHKEIHDDKPKACLYCNEKFVHMSSLTRHMRRTHNNFFISDEKKKNENVQCSECNLVYLRKSIGVHMKTHTGIKPFSCVICNKSFTTKWNLKLHKWTHANRSSKPFKCHLCAGAFMRQTDYVSHMNAHKSVRPYTCNHCGCQFIRKYNCQRHVKEHENEKKFVCEIADCGKSFHRSYYLSEHLKVHSGVRPYSCNICGKTSSTKSNHNKHVKIHHAREPVTTEA